VASSRHTWQIYRIILNVLDFSKLIGYDISDVKLIKTEIDKMNLEQMIRIHAKVLLETSSLPVSSISQITGLSAPSLWSIRRMVASLTSCVLLIDKLAHDLDVTYKLNPEPFEDGERARARKALFAGKTLDTTLVTALGWEDTIIAYNKLKTRVTSDQSRIPCESATWQPPVTRGIRRKLKGVKP